MEIPLTWSRATLSSLLLCAPNQRKCNSRSKLKWFSSSQPTLGCLFFLFYFYLANNSSTTSLNQPSYVFLLVNSWIMLCLTHHLLPCQINWKRLGKTSWKSHTTWDSLVFFFFFYFSNKQRFETFSHTSHFPCYRSNLHKLHPSESYEAQQIIKISNLIHTYILCQLPMRKKIMSIGIRKI